MKQVLFLLQFLSLSMMAMEEEQVGGAEMKEHNYEILATVIQKAPGKIAGQNIIIDFQNESDLDSEQVNKAQEEVPEVLNFEEYVNGSNEGYCSLRSIHYFSKMGGIVGIISGALIYTLVFAIGVPDSELTLIHSMCGSILGLGALSSAIAVCTGIQLKRNLRILNTTINSTIDNSIKIKKSILIFPIFNVNNLQEIYGKLISNNTTEAIYNTIDHGRYPFTIADQFDLTQDQGLERRNRIYTLCCCFKGITGQKLSKDILSIILFFDPSLMPHRKSYMQFLVGLPNCSDKHRFEFFSNVPLNWHKFYCNEYTGLEVLHKLEYAKNISMQLTQMRTFPLLTVGESFFRENPDILANYVEKTREALFSQYLSYIIDMHFNEHLMDFTFTNKNY